MTNEHVLTEILDEMRAIRRLMGSEETAWGGQIVRIPCEEPTRVNGKRTMPASLAEEVLRSSPPNSSTPDSLDELMGPRWKLCGQSRETTAFDKTKNDIAGLFDWFAKKVTHERDRLDKDIREARRTLMQAPHTKGNCEPVIARALAASDRIAMAQAQFQKSLEHRLGTNLLQTLRQADAPDTLRTPAQTPSGPGHNTDQNTAHDESSPFLGNEDA
jgi:hypothetical protein